MQTVFFVHDVWTTPRVWEQYQRYFEKLGYRTLAPALPQHFSRNQAVHVENLSLSDYTAQLEKDFHALSCSNDEVIIVGHGVGCVLALQLAMRVSPRAIALLSPASPAEIAGFIPPPRAVSELVLKPFFWKRGIKPCKASANDFLFNAMSETEAESAYDYLCHESGNALYELWFWYADPSNAASISREQIDCPILTLSGDQDMITPYKTARKLSRHLGQGRHFHCLTGFGHMLPLEDTSFQAAKQIHVWLCWQLGMQTAASTQAEGLKTATE